ncbi:hypothetical protein CMUS01_16068 [Colletotrichum musicola]|uniref:Aminotransferase class-III n=1 Tax=Colletotrichum musicola TaxID=2175873 RepID=A0A8H6IS04_9PEZI|nr:hypothetical protein CMUS01_16068 [Colletotrichum musicola]
MAVPAGLPLRKLDHDFNNAEGSILSFDQMQALTMSNPLWREFVGNRMGLERRYPELLHAYEDAFTHYFGGYRPIDYRHTSADTMDPDTIVKIILTLAEIPMSEPSDSSESPFTDEDDTLRRIGWEDIQAKKPRWALLADTYAAATSSSKAVSAKSPPQFSSSKRPYGKNPILLHAEGVSNDELREQLRAAKEAGCIGVILEIVENQYNGRVLSPELLARLSAACAAERLLLAADETLTAIRCGAPFAFQREEYVASAAPDLVFFGKATGAHGTAVSFDGAFFSRLGVFADGSSRARAMGRWRAQVPRPLPTANLIHATAALEAAVRGNFAMLSRIVGQAIRAFILERAAERGCNGQDGTSSQIEARDVLGGLESLIFVRRDIAGAMLVMGAGTAAGAAWVPWVRWLPRLETELSRSEVLDEVVGSTSRRAREEMAGMLVRRGAGPSWCFWCGGRRTAAKDDWCRRCCVGACGEEVCGRHFTRHEHI